jgi:hypothetical protein
VTGNVAPEAEKPDPVTAAEFTVTAAVPLEVKVTDFVTAVFNATLPNDSEVVLTDRVGVPAFAFSCSPNPLETPPALAVSVTDCAVLTADAVAVNPALVALAGTVIEAGIVTALLLLDRLTGNPPLGAAELNVTVQASVPAPVNVELLQVKAVRAAVAGAA